jgi:hypothetical protein
MNPLSWVPMVSRYANAAAAAVAVVVAVVANVGPAGPKTERTGARDPVGIAMAPQVQAAASPETAPRVAVAVPPMVVPNELGDTATFEYAT